MIDEKAHQRAIKAASVIPAEPGVSSEEAIDLLAKQARLPEWDCAGRDALGATLNLLLSGGYIVATPEGKIARAAHVPPPKDPALATTKYEPFTGAVENPQRAELERVVIELVDRRLADLGITKEHA